MVLYSTPSLAQPNARWSQPSHSSWPSCSSLVTESTGLVPSQKGRRKFAQLKRCVWPHVKWTRRLTTTGLKTHYEIGKMWKNNKVNVDLITENGDRKQNFIRRRVKYNSSTSLSLNSGYFMSWNCSLYYRVSIKTFPDYKHLLQENYVEYKHIELCTVQMCCKKNFLCWVTFKKNIYVCIPRSLLVVINVCNQGKTLCSPCTTIECSIKSQQLALIILHPQLSVL
jgi:hypothetical protein